MFDFDKIIERQSDKCRKWDHTFVCSRFGDVPESFIPLWIADMDFTSPPAVIDGFRRIVEHGTFGYTWCFTNSTTRSLPSSANVIRLRWKSRGSR